MSIMTRLIGFFLVAVCVFELTCVFYVGWSIEEPYPPEWFENEETHAWGLKFMPPCKPFGTDVSCGIDLILMALIGILVFFLVYGIGLSLDVNFESINDNKKYIKKRDGTWSEK